MKNKTSWGNVADWYDRYLSDEDSYQNKVILPNLIRIINPKKDLKILDLACGQGFFSFQFAEKGASVTGIDISKELIKIAKETAVKRNFDLKNNYDLNFFVAPANNLEIIKKEKQKFDTIVCVLAAQNIKELDQTISECASVLRDKGNIIFVLNHPSFRVPQYSDWYFNENRKEQGRVVYKYLLEKEIEIDMNPGRNALGKADSKKTYSYHRPLQSYIKWLSNNGFSITKIEEWASHKKSQNGPRSDAEDLARKEIPMFMCIEAKINNI